MVFTAVRSEGCHLNSGIERVVAMAAALGGSEAKERDMSSTQVQSETAIETPRARTVDMKLEVVVISVSDVANETWQDTLPLYVNTLGVRAWQVGKSNSSLLSLNDFSLQ